MMNLRDLFLSCILLSFGMWWVNHLLFDEDTARDIVLARTNVVVEQRRVRRWQRKCAHLEKEIVAWRNNPFLLEKMAREKLHLARPDEHLYFFRQPENNLHHV